MNEAVLDAKIQLVNEVCDKFTSSASAVVVEYRGLTVAEVTELRRELRKEGVDFKVYKNGVTRRAAEQAGYGDLNDQLVGPNAIAFSTDAVAPSRVLAKFAKKHDKLVLKVRLFVAEAYTRKEAYRKHHSEAVEYHRQYSVPRLTVLFRCP